MKKTALALVIFSFCTLRAAMADPQSCEAQLPDGSNYSGHCEDGVFQGLGRLEFRNGAVYEGQFEQGLMHGEGIYEVWETKEVITGRWVFGELQDSSPECGPVTNSA